MRLKKGDVMAGIQAMKTARMKAGGTGGVLVATVLGLALCLSIPAYAQESRVFAPAGLGVRDCGDHTRGGLGGRVIKVTNLNAGGKGSLQEALSATGARVVVFEVGGVIDLDMGQLRIRESFVTVAGETAPAPGVTVIRGGIGISTHDVVLRHLSVRPGDAGQPKKSGWEPDGITTSGGDAFNVLIENCSVTWAVDENLSASGPRTLGPDSTSHRITIRNCIIAEGLDDSSHRKGRHSKGSLIHDFCRDIAIVGNLYAHNVMRNPYFKAFTTGAIVNNLIYNSTRVGVQLYHIDAEFEGSGIVPEKAKVTVVGNVMVHGANTRPDAPLVGAIGEAYLFDNIAVDTLGQAVRQTAGDELVILEERPIWPEGLVALPSTETEAHVLANAGARPWDRDAIDRRIVEDCRNRRGRVIDSQEEVGGYPAHPEARRPLDPPSEAIEAWLASFIEDTGQ